MAGQERSRLSGLVASAAVVITALSVLPDPGAAETQPGGLGTSLLGTASAQGMRVTYTVPDFLVVSEVMDGGGPVAQSLLETGGQSTAFASLPYPGENGVGGPSLVLGLLGQSPPGSYPFYVRADSTVNPTVELRDPSGSYALRATAEAQKAIGAADVAFGAPDQPASSAAAHTEVLTDDGGSMTVTAETLFRGLSLADGLLSIASVESRSVTVYGPGETEPETTTRLTVDGARVGDRAVTIGPDGVRAFGAPLPAPGGGADALNQMLAQGGLSVRTVSAGAVKGGGAADALEIVSDHALPVPGFPRGVLSLRIGGATTALSAGSTPSLEGTTELPATPPDGDSGQFMAPPAAGAPVGGAPPGAGADSPDLGLDHVPALLPPAVADPVFGTGTEFSGNSRELGLFPPSSGTDAGSPAPLNRGRSRPVSSQSPLAPEARALYLLLAIAGVGTIVLSLAARVRKADS